MLGIDFQYRLDIRRLLACLLEHARQLGAHAVVLHYQASGAVHQAGGNAHVFGLVFERLFELGQGGLKGLGGVFGGFFLSLVLQAAQIHCTFGYALQRRALVLVQIVQSPLVHAVGHEQHFNTFFLEHFQLGAVFRSGQSVGGDVVHRLLAFLHARFVIGKGHAEGITLGGGKTQQLGKAVLVRKVFAQAFLKNGAELVVKTGVFTG